MPNTPDTTYSVSINSPTAILGTLILEEKGKLVAAQSGCLACHMIGDNGNGGPGPHLTDIGDKLEKGAIRRTLENPTAPMPSFRNLPEDKKSALVDFLSSLKGGTEAG